MKGPLPPIAERINEVKGPLPPIDEGKGPFTQSVGEGQGRASLPEPGLPARKQTRR